MRMGGPIVKAEDVRVERGRDVLLDGISLEVEARERLLVQGPSGAGKTTLFEVLGLLEPPTAGRLLIDGTDVTTLSERRRAGLRRDRIGIVFQDFQLVPDLTARENARLPQRHGNTSDEEWLDRLFSRLELEDVAARYPASLSGGEKQRVAVARALANRPAVVLADEPTGQLDPESADRVLELLLTLHQEADAALVVVSHDPVIADQFSDRLEIRDGRLVK